MDWTLATDGALALQPDRPRLNEPPRSVRVADDMPSARASGRRRVERRGARAARRSRQVALLVLLAAILVVSLLVTAFGGSSASTAPTRSLAGADLVPAQPQQTRPYPEILAVRGGVRLQLPIAQSQVTAIGYHAADDGALALAPAGHQRNEGLVQRVVHAIFGGGGGSPGWYRLGGGATSALDVGAPVGATVYAPVDGTVVSITPYVVGGRRYGSRIDIQPQSAPQVVVSLTQLRVDPSLTVGSTVVSGARKLGTVANLALAEQQTLARFTNDAGNHVTVEIRPASSYPIS
jgi:hypothetical protein